MIVKGNAGHRDAAGVPFRVWRRPVRQLFSAQKLMSLRTLGELINVCGRSLLKFLQSSNLNGEVSVFIQQVCRLCGNAKLVTHAVLTQIGHMRA